MRGSENTVDGPFCNHPLQALKGKRAPSERQTRIEPLVRRIGFELWKYARESQP